MSIANSGVSTTTSASAYQTSGKPLSKEALYRAKLKHGIFESPSTKTTGFSNATDASDTAALLAASSDLTVEPYKRTVASDAQTAALLARDDAPEAWTRKSVDSNAQYAAQNAKITKVTLEQRSVKNQGSAAAAALHLSAKSIASSSLSSKNLDSLYEFDAVRNGTQRPTNAFNLSKINLVSKERASTMISNRTDPERDVSRSGLQTKGERTLSNQAAAGALASKGFELPEPEVDTTLADYAAAGALASQGYKVPEDPNLEAKAVYRNQLIDPKVLAVASLNAANTLKGIEKDVNPRSLYYNQDFNKKALEIAQRHSEKRLANDKSGKINIGGGLFMTQDELDAIASKFVDPVLDDISKQAEAQRAKDAEVARIEAENKRKYEEAKQEEKNKKLEEKRQKEEAKIQRRKELEDEKLKQVQAKKELEDLKKEELAKTQEIFNTKQIEEQKRKDELAAKKESETERLAREAAEAEEKRKGELDVLESEKNDKLAPILKDLEGETEKLTLLEQERKAAEDITASQTSNIENSKLLLETSHKELNDLEEELTTLQADIEKAQSEEEKLTKEKEISEKETEIALKKHKDNELGKEVKRLELEKEKNEVEKQRLGLLLDLENEKVDALHDEKKILETLPPAEKKKVTTGAGPSLVSPITGEGEEKLTKTFSGFSQGSDDQKEVNDQKKRKSFFKEFF